MTYSTPIRTGRLYPTQGISRPVFGYVRGHGKQEPGYGPEGVLTVHPSKYEIQNAYAYLTKLVYNLSEKMRQGVELTNVESIMYANAKHHLNKLDGYKKPYFY